MPTMTRRSRALTLPALALLLAALACSPSPSTATPVPQAQLSAVAVIDTPVPQPTAASSGSCDYDYFPTEGDTMWEYAGTSPATGSYQRIDTVSESTDDGFVVTEQFPDKTLSVHYSCSDAGLIMLDPIQSPVTAVASGPSGTAIMRTLAHSGITLPADLQEGMNWQHYLQWEAVGDSTIPGEYTFESTALTLEVVTVPYGTYDAMDIETEMTGQVAGHDIGNCQISTWVAKDIGILKQDFSCPALGFTNSIELVDFDSP
jgi:hypothetical protein